MSQATSPKRAVCPSCLQPVPVGEGPARKRVRCPQCLAVFAVGGEGGAGSGSVLGPLSYVVSFCAFMALAAWYWVGIRNDPKCFVLVTVLGLFGLAGFIPEKPPAWLNWVLEPLWVLMGVVSWMVGLLLRCLGAEEGDLERPPPGSRLVIHVQLLAIYLVANLLGWACRPLL